MQVICDGLDLADAVQTTLKATSSRTTNPILEGIKLEAKGDKLILSATDLDLSIIKTIKAEVKEEGEVVVPGNFFNEYIRKISNSQIELVLLENNLLKVTYDGNEGSIQCFKTDEFPILNKVDNADYFEIYEKDLKSLIDKSIFSVAVDSSRPILRGCLFEVNDNKITSVALDGYRMAIVNENIIKATNNLSVVVPARSLGEISRILEEPDKSVKVYIEKNYLMVEINGTTITTRLLEGEFIDYKKILPKHFSTNVIVNRSQFSGALERASLLASDDKNHLVKLTIKEGKILLESNSDIGNIREFITVNLEGNDIEIAFNQKYLSNAMSVVSDEFVKMNMTSPASPCIITSSTSDEYLFFILPVRRIN
jgi:DNA polymerase III subunit beta